MTGREAILKAASEIGLALSDAEQIASAVYAMGYVCVPKQPTELMVKNAWADAMAEDAAGVWACMIQGNEDPIAALESLQWTTASCHISAIPKTDS